MDMVIIMKIYEIFCAKEAVQMLNFGTILVIWFEILFADRLGH